MSDEFEGVELTKEEPTEAPLRDWTQEWKDYVFSQIPEDDITPEGNPTIDGLLYAAEHFVGEVNYLVDVLQTPDTTNERRATVKVTVYIGHEEDQIRIEEAADAYSGNCGTGNHPVASATTRALGRALKRVLKLRKTLTEDEVSQPDTNVNLFGDKSGKIVEVQIKGIDKMCKMLDMNVKRFLEVNLEDVTNLLDVSYDDAKTLLAALNSYRNTGVEDDMKGYDESWKKEFGV